jgi:hypothetical protein
MPNNKIQDYVFYKLVSLDASCNLCYVGSTANFKERRRNHKTNCNNENSEKYNTKVYKTIRENGGWQNFKMVEIGTAPQLTKRQAEQVEEEYRQTERANMNGKKCYLTDEEKREYDKKQKQQNYLNNRDKLKEISLQYYLNNRDKKKEYKQQYYQKNRDKHVEQRRQYCLDNRDKIKEKITCECGCEIVRVTLSRHQKTKKHLKLMEVVQK